MKKKIAFFDFDGTLTTHDTLLEFIKFLKGSSAFYWGFLINSPYLVAYKLKIISNQSAKEKVMKHFFGNMSVKDFNEQCRLFSEQQIPRLIRPGVLEEMKKLREKGVQIVIVSASPENWLKHWADSIQAELLATRLEVVGDQLNGKISGINCHGEEKVRRIQEMYDLTQYEEISAFGDTSGDKPMLALAHHRHFKPFRTPA